VGFILLQLHGLVCEHGNKFGTDEFAFAFGIADAFELREETLGSVDADDAKAEAVAEHFERVFEFIFAEQAGVDEDIGEAVADGAMHEHSGDGGIDAPAERADYAAVPYFGSNRFGGFLDEGRATPFLFGLADAKEKIAENFRAAIGVADFGMEFDGINLAVGIFDGRDGVLRAPDGSKAWGQAHYVVAVTVPDAQRVGKFGEKLGFVSRVFYV
jgi:hypothetical protein